MKDNDMDDFLKSYIDAGQKMPPVPPALSEKVWQKLQPTLDAVDAMQAVEGPAAGAGVSAGKGLWPSLVGVVLGASVALPVGYQLGQREPMTALPAKPPPALAPMAAPPVDLTPAPAFAPVPDKPAPSFKTASSSTDIEQELRVIEQLRTALLKQQWAAFDEAFTEHASRFPKGQLNEERDVMRIQRWLLSGNTAQAKERFVEFQKRYPNSQWAKTLAPQFDTP